MRFLLLLHRGCKKHLKIKGTRNYYFKTIGYCSRTKVKSSLILRGFYVTWPWALTLGLKCYYLWELYHAWVLVITFVLSTDVARSTMGLVWIKKSLGRNLNQSSTPLLIAKCFRLCKMVYCDSLCEMLLRDLKRLSLIMLCLSKNLILLLYIIIKFLKTMGELKS